MYIDIRNADAAPLLASANVFAQVIEFIPQCSKVEAIFFNGIWYHVCWNAYSGFMQAIYLTAFDPSPARWIPRYGKGSRSAEVKPAFIAHIMNIQHDLNAFFYPFEPQLSVNGLFDKETMQSVAKFQQIRGLTVNGITTPETKSSLYAASLRLRSNNNSL